MKTAQSPWRPQSHGRHQRNRAPLFVPANRPDRFEKAAHSGADAIILDLEDAIATDSKNDARAALRCDFTDLPVIIRIKARTLLARE